MISTAIDISREIWAIGAVAVTSAVMAVSKKGSLVTFFISLIGFVRRAILFFIVELSWLPGALGTIGLSYLSLPSDVRRSFNSYVPSGVEEILFNYASERAWLVSFFGVSLLLLIWGTLGSYIRSVVVQRVNNRLFSEVEELKGATDKELVDTYEVFSIFVKGYYKRFGMGVDERVSLYVIDGDNFMCIGRYSDNELYRQGSRNVYRSDRGCLGQSWERNKSQAADFPDPVMDLEAYIAKQVKDYGYDESAVRDMKMKSRAYFGIRLKTPHDKSIAVIIFESTRVDGLKFGKIDRYMNVDEQRRLGQLILSLQDHIPSLDEARQEGF